MLSGPSILFALFVRLAYLVGMEKPAPDKRKQSLYFPSDMLKDIKLQAARLDRSLSWVVQYCWKHGRRAVAGLPDHNVGPEADKDVGETGDPADKNLSEPVPTPVSGAVSQADGSP